MTDVGWPVEADPSRTTCMHCEKPGATLLDIPPHDPADHVLRLDTGEEWIVAAGVLPDDVDWSEWIEAHPEVVLWRLAATA